MCYGRAADPQFFKVGLELDVNDSIILLDISVNWTTCLCYRTFQECGYLLCCLMENAICVSDLRTGESLLQHLLFECSLSAHCICSPIIYWMLTEDIHSIYPSFYQPHCLINRFLMFIIVVFLIPQKGKKPRGPSAQAANTFPNSENSNVQVAVQSSATAPPSTENSVQRHRRKTIPERPNYSINLWSIMKNCIGKELSKIPMPVSRYEWFNIWGQPWIFCIYGLFILSSMHSHCLYILLGHQYACCVLNCLCWNLQLQASCYVFNQL